LEVPLESWLPAIFGFGGVLVGSFFSLWFTRLQLKHQRETDSQHWRRNVKSEPLLQMRTELAVMATKLEKLAKQGKSFTVPAKTAAQEKEALDKAVEDWNSYVTGDYLEKVLYSQFDVEIVNRVREIRNEYLDTYDDVVTYREELSPSEFGEAARAAEEKLRPKVAEIQELINKQLEEL
jgi:hypothetical protein